MISACGKSDERQQALDLLAEMRCLHSSPAAMTYSTAISAFRTRGQFQQARALMAEMRRVIVLCDVLTYTAAASAHGQALDILTVMRSV